MERSTALFPLASVSKSTSQNRLAADTKLKVPLQLQGSNDRGPLPGA